MEKKAKLSMTDVQELDQSRVMQPWSKQGGKKNRVIVKADGVLFWDQDDKKYYDMSSQLVYANLGHRHPRMLKALDQLSEQQIVATGFASEAKSKLSDEIIKVAPSNMSKVYYTMAGAEANEHAMKIARMFTNKFKIFSRYRSYHGSTFGAGNLTGENRRFQVEPGGISFIKFPTPYQYRDDLPFKDEKEYTAYYLTQLENQIIYEGPDTVAAIVVEPVPGSNGVLIPPKGYLKGIEKICRRYQIMFICDEVMTGFGRTGEWFAVDHEEVKPDMITFAKGVTAGYLPLGGVIVSEEIAKFFDENVLMTGSTYSGHALACSIGAAALSVYQQEKTVAHVKEMEPILAARLEKLKAFKHVGDVRNIGLFAAVELVKNKATKEPILGYGLDYGRDPENYMSTFFEFLTKHGFYTYSHESCVFISPPLIINETEINEAMDLFELALKDFEERFPDLA